MPASWAYFLSPWALKFYSRLSPPKPCDWRPFSWRGLHFKNPLGTAGGIDKNALYVKEWQALGAGFVEVGTVTPKAQLAHKGKIVARSLKHQSLWNNMGFPNKGLDFVRQRLFVLKAQEKAFRDPLDSQKKAFLSIPVFVSIGKNRQTPISQALADYQQALQAFWPLASAFVINISSPNTKDLRDLLSEKQLPLFLKSLKQIALETSVPVFKKTKENQGFKKLNEPVYPSVKNNKAVKKVPLILKLSPDNKDFIRIIEQSLEAGIDGWCVCNSTNKRSVPGLFPQKGGVSGGLLASQSLSLLKTLSEYLTRYNIKDKLVISCGGVFTVQDVLERLSYGANLIQVYSALTFKGPGFFHSIYKQMLLNQQNKRS